MMSFAVVAACSVPEPAAPRSTVRSSTSTSTSAARTDGEIPEPPPVDQWTTASDPDSGVSFALPGEAKVNSRAGAAATTTIQYSVEVGGHPALDYRLSFTARNGEKTIWFARVIGAGTRGIHLQGIGSSAPGAEVSVTPVIERYHRLLVDAVRLS